MQTEIASALARRVEAAAEEIRAVMREASARRLPPAPFLALAKDADALEISAARIDLNAGVVTLEGAA